MRAMTSPFAHERRNRPVGNDQHVQTQVLVNPHGSSFEVLRTRRVVNSLIYGRRVLRHSWYPGFAWQCVACKGCLAHLGWFFTPQDKEGEGDPWFEDEMVEQEGEEEEEEEAGGGREEVEAKTRQEEDARGSGSDDGTILPNETNSHAPRHVAGKEDLDVADMSQLPGLWVAEMGSESFFLRVDRQGGEFVASTIRASEKKIITGRRVWTMHPADGTLRLVSSGANDVRASLVGLLSIPSCSNR
ncbi:hypothetical protein GUITHDRAFT_108957 [Guillardia theta CCMP2712]|uniref:CULT domain-containing protein n=1 Tax=Guillardia theta (strain CCMP2712) TaxID=905079 RepID=L1J9V9_GUITC|nr:hypothetical protein GUITHDRAFT_108957 [Guillardia theta CCMP2712]EKX45318.1 hypothetical protein GUITHDRAFT_108957 [Guillardia theta CCMP2712]|eukprot:XP_005832298.1 hypothetical protein GUITHDRAFT_108957 [Guillardia theta CCMP2712]